MAVFQRQTSNNRHVPFAHATGRAAVTLLIVVGCAAEQTEAPPVREVVSHESIVSRTSDIRLNLIPAGRFRMGSGFSQETLAAQYAAHGAQSAEFDQEMPQHDVRISKPFFLSVCEVTKGQFAVFVDATGYLTDAETGGVGGYGWNGNAYGFVGPDPEYTWKNPGFYQTDDHPVVNVSWNDAVAFCRWLTEEDGRHYRLPTEAEWEYACRAGAQSQYCFGDDPDELVRYGNIVDRTMHTRFPQSLPINGYDGFVFTAPVSSYQPNQFGIHDMHGNAYEWCRDWFAEGYDRESRATDPQGPAEGTLRVLRGGSWCVSPHLARSAFRNSFQPGFAGNMFGFRVAADLAEPAEEEQATEPVQ